MSPQLNACIRTKQQAFNDNWNDAVKNRHHDRICKLVTWALKHGLEIPITVREDTSHVGYMNRFKL